MLAANLFDHPALLLIVAAVTLLRWLISKAKSGSAAAPPPATPTQPITRRAEAQTEEERVRRFLEALGQPPGSTPPKLAPRQRQVQPKIFPRLPPLTTAPPPLPQSTVATPPAPPPLPLEPRAVTSARGPDGDFEVHEVARQTSSEPVPDTRRLVGPRLDLQGQSRNERRFTQRGRPPRDFRAAEEFATAGISPGILGGKDSYFPGFQTAKRMPSISTSSI